VSTLAGRFDPLQLRSEASLNRTRIAPLAGADPALVGRPAFEVLSLAALTVLTSAGVGETMATYGQRLAHLIATLLVSGPPDASLSPWRAAYRRYWTTVEQVWLGGGIARRFGPALAGVVRAELRRLHAPHGVVDVAPHADVLPLLGLARTRPGPDGQRAVLDFGHSAVKRGIATIQAGRLVRLDVLPSRPAPEAASAVECVLDCVADTVRMAQSRPGRVHPGVRLSLATYLWRGRPADPHSIYAVLGALSRSSLQQELQRRTQAPVRLSYVHDGTAGARAVSSQHRAALIMLGTALGVGFAPPPGSLVPIADGLVIADST
jgi:hypothetical protein